MKWQDAKVEARRLADEVSRNCSTGAIVVREYKTRESYSSFEPDSAWSWEVHTQVIRALKRELRDRGLRLQVVRIDA